MTIANYSICQIEYEINEDEVLLGTSFLIKLSIPSEEIPMFGLLTNNHVIDSNHLKPNFEFKIIMKNINKELYFKINNSKFAFTSKFIDIIFIQFTESFIKQEKLYKKYFLCPCANTVETDENIYIIQYPKGDALKFAHGKIKINYGFDCLHTCSTQSGSSGSPLINDDLKVFSIHKLRRGKKLKKIRIKKKKKMKMKTRIEKMKNMMK